jgi:hypothetical protein
VNVLVREDRLKGQDDVVGVGARNQTDALRPRIKARGARNDRGADDRQTLELESSVGAGCRYDQSPS